MYCPSCRDEFRDGFTRCESCGVDLVADLSGAAAPARPAPTRADVAVPPVFLADFCGFLSLGEARQARDRLRGEGVRCEIVLREAPDADLSAACEEEAWLRIDRDAAKLAHTVLGFDTVDAADDDSFACGDCGGRVAADESFCPGCGARFDD